MVGIVEAHRMKDVGDGDGHDDALAGENVGIEGGGGRKSGRIVAVDSEIGIVRGSGIDWQRDC